MSRKEIRHELARMEQDRQFIQNAHYRQKIYAGLFVAFIAVFWACIVKYDAVNIWWGVLMVPLILFGIWLMVTKRNYPWEMLNEE